MRRTVLITVSNHDPRYWDPAQRGKWDEIIYIPFPNVEPALGGDEFLRLCEEIIDKIEDTIENVKYDNDVVFNIQGDYSVTFVLWRKLVEKGYERFAFPTSFRKTTEKTLPDGSVQKVSEYKFVRWR